MLNSLCATFESTFVFLSYSCQVGNFAGLGLIIFSALVTNSGSADTKIWSKGWQFYVSIALPCFLALVIVTLLASFLQLQPPERV